MKKNEHVAVLINTKDRPTELALLLQSLREQTYQDFSVWILDDGGGTPLQNYSFLMTLLNLMRCEGHRVSLQKNPISKGVCISRQQLVDYVLENSDAEYLLRIDDDTICDRNYIQFLWQTLQYYHTEGQKFSIASGVTPPANGTGWIRETKFVTPIINRVVLDDKGRFLVNSDDCGYQYLSHEIIPTDHFRSSAMIRRYVHEQIRYEYTLTPCGFREEEFFSFRSIIAGFNIGVHTGAINWHLQTPSGGDRRKEYAELSHQNQRLLNRFIKECFRKHGDFIEQYHQRLGVVGSNKFQNLNKNNNLIYNREE